MSIPLAQQGDFNGLKLVRLAKLSAVDMTTAAVYNVYNNGPNTVLLLVCALHNFSAFTESVTNLPATWAFTYGTAKTGATAPTAPNNMRTAQTPSGVSPPYLIGQGITTTSPYIPPFFTLYFAVSTATNGVGTFDVTFYGGILAK